MHIDQSEHSKSDCCLMIIDTIVAIFYWICSFGFKIVLKVAVISQLLVLHRSRRLSVTDKHSQPCTESKWFASAFHMLLNLIYPLEAAPQSIIVS